jgi:hypothetical protein
MIVTSATGCIDGYAGYAGYADSALSTTDGHFHFQGYQFRNNF